MDDCPHDDFVILGSNRTSYGTCSKCGKEVHFYVLLNNWKAKVDRMLAEALGKKEGGT